MSENPTPPVEIQTVSPARRLAWIGGITHSFYISNNPYICKKKDHERLQHAVQERGN
jgi:hypothetical protein